MPKLIKNKQIVNDHWQLHNDINIDLSQYANQDLIVSLPCWLENQAVLHNHSAQLGVWLDSHEFPEQLGNAVHAFALIALRFPVFRDGRPYSSARELRLNLHYQGELRAIGDVLRDQLFYMARCGFNSFALREDQDLHEALSAFEDFHDGYQACADRPEPLFRRRSS